MDLKSDLLTLAKAIAFMILVVLVTWFAARNYPGDGSDLIWYLSY